MKFLRVMEQNDICNLLKNMDIANRKFSYNRNGDIFLRYHHYIHVQVWNN